MLLDKMWGKGHKPAVTEIPKTTLSLDLLDSWDSEAVILRLLK